MHVDERAKKEDKRQNERIKKKCAGKIEAAIISKVGQDKTCISCTTRGCTKSAHALNTSFVTLV